jgi:hypothetical protein
MGSNTSVGDWNWFFSSLAQSVAALVGVLAAFMIARLLNSQAEFSRNASRADELLIGAERLRDAVKIRYFDWYNGRTNNAAIARVVADLNDEPDLFPEQRYQKAGFSVYTPRNEAVKTIEAAIAQVERDRKEEEEKERNRRTGYGFTMPNLNIQSMASVMANSAAQQELTQEGEEIERLTVEVKHHIRQIRAHLTAIEANPERSSVVTATLVAGGLLFYIGIIYPLSFLPVLPGEKFDLSLSAFFSILFSLRGLLLGLVTIVFSVLLLVLHRINEALRHDPAKLENLRAALSLGWYSRFFQTREENQAATAAGQPPPTAG